MGLVFFGSLTRVGGLKGFCWVFVFFLLVLFFFVFFFCFVFGFIFVGRLELVVLVFFSKTKRMVGKCPVVLGLEKTSYFCSLWLF